MRARGAVVGLFALRAKAYVAEKSTKARLLGMEEAGGSNPPESITRTFSFGVLSSFGHPKKTCTKRREKRKTQTSNKRKSRHRERNK